jgi:hypothetical protein
VWLIVVFLFAIVDATAAATHHCRYSQIHAIALGGVGS